MANRKLRLLLRQLPWSRTNDMIKMLLRMGPGFGSGTGTVTGTGIRMRSAPLLPSISSSIPLALGGFGGVLYVTIADRPATLQCKFCGIALAMLAQQGLPRRACLQAIPALRRSSSANEAVFSSSSGPAWPPALGSFSAPAYANLLVKMTHRSGGGKG